MENCKHSHKSKVKDNKVKESNNSQVSSSSSNSEISESAESPFVSDIDDYEIGNLLFGNARGEYNFPDRDLVDSAEWKELTYIIDSITHQRHSYRNLQHYRNNLIRCTDSDTGEIIFEYFPYWWGDCTCGADRYNHSVEEKLLKEIFTEDEAKAYRHMEEFCTDESCPSHDIFNNLSFDEQLDVMEGKAKDTYNLLVSNCKCGAWVKNFLADNLKNTDKYKEHLVKFQERYRLEAIEHDRICSIMRHNFLYRPGTRLELGIDWYKYPFRDSHTTREITSEEFLQILRDCLNNIR